MNPIEVLPLLIAVLLLVAAGGADVEQMEIHFEGEHDIKTIHDVLVIAGGSNTVPGDASIAGDVYVIGGTTRITGDIDGDVTILAGNVTITSGATVTGTMQQISGESTIDEEATIGEVSVFEPPAPSPSPARRIGTFAVQFIVLALVGWWFVRRHPTLLETVGHAITDHSIVSGVVGTLAAVTLLVLFVYMAFTLILIPISILGLLAELLIVLYAQVVFGHLIGARLRIQRPGLATVVGIGVFLLTMEALGAIPVIGALIQFGLLVVGFGAVLNTYFGLQRFEPVSIPLEA